MEQILVTADRSSFSEEGIQRPKTSDFCARVNLALYGASTLLSEINKFQCPASSPMARQAFRPFSGTMNILSRIRAWTGVEASGQDSEI